MTPEPSNSTDGHRRGSSSSTVRFRATLDDATLGAGLSSTPHPPQGVLWVHDDAFSQEDVLINPSILEHAGILEGDLVEITLREERPEVRDFENDDSDSENERAFKNDHAMNISAQTPCLCVVKFATPTLLTKHPGLEISMTRTIADAFGLRPRSQVVLQTGAYEDWTASHIELSFRDAYLARSDMWRLVSQELGNKVVYKGQKISFLGSMKLIVKEVHVAGHRMSTGFFSGRTIPVFRSEAARFVLFIQMSREMWDFDSEGNGEIMFNRVVNGFLPDLFRRWVLLEVRHLVSIVMFGRLEYDSYDFSDSNAAVTAGISRSSSASNASSGFHQDFYRVVVTDMASAQWTTILNELKKDFRVFLRDISLHTPVSIPIKHSAHSLPTKITGRPSTALKGNILEAINMASSQFANDYIDRDLIRTGVSTVVITAGAGVFDVDRDLLNLTSENLTNNGIGIDIVCLSRMPLHSVPLFRYQLPASEALSRADSEISDESRRLASSQNQPSVSSVNYSSALSSFAGTGATYFSRFPSAFPSKVPQPYSYGIPQWIDLSYWSPSSNNTKVVTRNGLRKGSKRSSAGRKRDFVPRVRMYELQMMGLMELGMADISIPYLAESTSRQNRSRRQPKPDKVYPASTRSLSQSPTYVRKGSALGTRQRDTSGVLSSKIKASGTTFENMEEYDDTLFLDMQKPKKGSKPLRQRSQKAKGSVHKQDLSNHKTDKLFGSQSSGLSTNVPRELSQSSPKTTGGNSSRVPQQNLKTKPKVPRISRSISYALRGLTPSLRSTATSEASFENVKAQPSVAITSLAQANAATSSQKSRTEPMISLESHDNDQFSVLSADSSSEYVSKPISISNSTSKPVSEQVTDKLETPMRNKGLEKVPVRTDSGTWLSSPSVSSGDEATKALKALRSMPDSVPQSTLPFIRNVNASNPLKRYPKAESAFGRWQHLYPHKPRNSMVKWRSLCTPASVPLTTDDFPTAEQLEKNYETREHTVRVRKATDMPEVPVDLDSLLLELISLRLSHGYQIIVGEAVREAVGAEVCEVSAFLDPHHLSQHGNMLLMCMGNTIQRLSFTDPELIHVTKYIKKDVELNYPFPSLYSYVPNIRTILAADYAVRPIELRGFTEEYPWETADNYLADGSIDSTGRMTELRFWRARFVLLPVEPPMKDWRPQNQSNEESEEEIHLLGIRSLTQMWQRARYVPISERKSGQARSSHMRKGDQNPLEIKYETLNPSEIVATELDKLLALEESGEILQTQLLPDSEKLDRDAPMIKLAQAMQGERGIEIKNRRWHFRLHYNCFHGEEFTNWLLHNIKNLETRDDAVDFGKQLMKEGLIEHVNGRHDFKDGNYFYSLAPEFKVPRLDLKGSWFPGSRRFDRSVPPTPISEHPSKDISQTTTRSRSGSSLAFSLNPATPLESSKQFLERKRKSVNLRKTIRIDVDSRKRSNKAECVDLHYDRFHNPENCYHIELSWLNTTSKLVDDAIVSWSTQAEKYGLKMVEVPIAEACKVPDAEPFRKAYRVKLALEPPKRPTVSHIMTSSSFTPQPYSNAEKYVYQKAILRRFNFVLDIEGLAEFPENVDVQHSTSGLAYKYTQYVHRSGVGLAQIDDEGDFLLLSNRLYNARLINVKEGNTAKFDSKRDIHVGPGYSHRPALPPQHNLNLSVQASGIIGPNAQSPKLSAALSATAAFSPFHSPLPRTTADVLNARSGPLLGSIPQYVTPEQLKDELEAFCNDPAKLEQFYKEVNLGPTPPHPTPGGLATKLTSNGIGTNPSALGPIPDANEGIPEFVLPESLASPSTSTTSAIGGGGSGLAFGNLISRRARSVAYDSVVEMFGRSASASASDSAPNLSSEKQTPIIGPRKPTDPGPSANENENEAEAKNEDEDEPGKSDNETNSGDNYSVDPGTGDTDTTANNNNNISSRSSSTADNNNNNDNDDDDDDNDDNDETNTTITTSRPSRNVSNRVDEDLETKVTVDVPGPGGISEVLIEEGMKDAISSPLLDSTV